MSFKSLFCCFSCYIYLKIIEFNLYCKYKHTFILGFLNDQDTFFIYLKVLLTGLF